MNITKAYNTVLKGGMVGIVAYPLSITCGFFLNAVLTRSLPPHQVGIYSLAMTIFGILETISNVGCGTATRKYLPVFKEKGEPQTLRYLLWAVFLTPLVVGLLIGFLLYLLRARLAGFFFSELETILPLGVLIIPLLAMLTTSTNFFYAIFSPIVSNLIEIISKRLLPAIVLLVLFLLKVSVDVKLVLIIMALSLLLIFVVTIFSINYFVQSFWGSIKGSTFKLTELYKFSVPLTFSGFFTMLYLYTDNVLLGALSTTSTVAVYNMAFVVSMIIAYIPMRPIRLMLLSVFSLQISEGKEEGVARLYATLTRLSYFFSIPLALIFMLFSGKILSLLFGSFYSKGSLALSVLASFYLLCSLFDYSTTLIIARDKTKVFFIGSLVGLFLSILFNLLLIPKFGAVGAAVATGIAELSLRLTYFSFTGINYWRKLYFHRFLILFVLALLLITPIRVFIVPINIYLAIILIFAALVAYFSIYWFLNLILSDDKKLVLTWFRHREFKVEID